MLNLDAERIPDPPAGRFVIITPTCGAGDCPEPVLEFLSTHHDRCVGSIIGGNRNFGSDFAGAGNVLRDRFNFPVLYRFELFGTDQDVEICRKGILQCLK